MPIVSAQNYVKGILVGMVPPGDTGIRLPIDALITPLDPDVNPDGIARCYVWPAKGPEKRLAMPRNTGKNTPAGWKQITHALEIFMVWMDSPDDPAADVNFPLFIDFVMDELRTSANPFQFTDPKTGRVSNMVNLGEVMSYDYVPPRSLTDMSMRRYDARIQCSLLELFQA